MFVPATAVQPFNGQELQCLEGCRIINLMRSYCIVCLLHQERIAPMHLSIVSFVCGGTGTAGRMLFISAVQSIFIQCYSHAFSFLIVEKNHNVRNGSILCNCIFVLAQMCLPNMKYHMRQCDLAATYSLSLDKCIVQVKHGSVAHGVPRSPSSTGSEADVLAIAFHQCVFSSHVIYAYHVL